MGENGFVKVRVTKDSSELIPVRHRLVSQCPPVVTLADQRNIRKFLIRFNKSPEIGWQYPH